MHLKSSLIIGIAFLEGDNLLESAHLKSSLVRREVSLEGDNLLGSEIWPDKRGSLW